MKDLTNIALKYHRSGAVVIPWRYENEAVKFPAWHKYQNGQTEKDVLYEFAIPAEGIALICTNGIEVIDIDVKNDPKGTVAKEYLDELFWLPGGEEILSKAVQVNTKSGGVHLIYRAGNVQGNQKLANRKNCKEAMIETRGPGGLLFVCPSPGYEITNGSMLNIPTIANEQRDLLINLARSMNEEPEMADRVQTQRKPVDSEGLTPWDDYNAKNDILGLLEMDGWTNTGRGPSGKVYLSKPDATNKRDTHGAILEAKDGTSIFWPFTTATQFESEKGYSAFAVYATLNHFGNFSEAAKELVRQGYGERRVEKKEEQPQQQPKKKEIFDILAFVKSTKFDVKQPITEEEAILTLGLDGKTYKIGGKGQVGAVVGEQKSGKSLITSCITASALGDKPILNFSLDLSGEMDYFDTEQSKYFYQWTQKRLYMQAGLRDNHPAYNAYYLRRLNIADRLMVIDEMLKGRKNLGCVVIDGIVDLCQNFNDEKESIRTVDTLLRWSDETGAMIITVLHVTKSMGFLRGHLGTALQNKADFVIQAKQDKGEGIYTVECRESRFAPFPSFTFTRDEKGFPVLDGEEHITDEIEESVENSMFPVAETTYNGLITRPPKMNDDEPIPF